MYLLAYQGKIIKAHNPLLPEWGCTTKYHENKWFNALILLIAVLKVDCSKNTDDKHCIQVKMSSTRNKTVVGIILIRYSNFPICQTFCTEEKSTNTT